jgi:Mrp family chromosome partitioning ATPase
LSDFSESERTIPSVAQLRRDAPRIAAPLAPDLKAAKASVSPNGLMKRPGSAGAPAPRMSDPQIALPAAVAAKEAVPVAVTRAEKSARQAVPAAAAPVAEPAPPAVAPSPQAIYAASVLTGSGPRPDVTLDTGAHTTTLAGSAPPVAVNDLVRVHQQPPSAMIDPRLVVAHAPDSPAAASFRVLRHRLTQPNGPKVILVTSPRAGEGKTVCAANLALALGEAGRARVLLLEMNFRRPALARMLGIRPPVCFSEQVEFHRAQPLQPWIVVESLSPSVHTAAASPDVAPRPLLDGPAVALCLEQLRAAGYDFIVLDSPPVLGSADVNLIEGAVDGIILAVSARRSRARAMRRAVEQIGKEKVLGVALMGS